MIKKFRHKLSKDANLKELLSGSALTFIIKITGMLIGYVVVLLVSRKYGAEGAGIYSLTTNLLNSLAILGGLGFNIAVLRYVGMFNKAANGLANMKQLFRYIVQLAFPFAVFIGVVLFFSADLIANQFFENSLYVPALKVGAVVMPFFTLNLINVEFIRGLKMLKVSEYLRSINRQLIVLIILGFSFLSYGVLDAVYAMVFGILVSFVISLFYILRYFKKNVVKNQHASFTRKELLKTSMPMMSSAVAGFILANSGAFFLEVYSSSAQVGVFNVCLRLAQLVSLVLLVVNTSSAPKFAELYWSGKKVELQKVINQTTKLIFIVSLFISVVLIIFSKLALSIFGSEFTVGTIALVILIIGQMASAATGSVGIFLNMSGNHKAYRNIIGITTVLVVVAYIIVIPRNGILGAAVVATLGTIVVNVVPAIYAYKKLHINTFYNPFSKVHKE